MLNDTRIRSAKPAERDYKLTDFDGLYLLVRPNGRTAADSGASPTASAASRSRSRYDRFDSVGRGEGEAQMTTRREWIRLAGASLSLLLLPGQQSANAAAGQATAPDPRQFHSGDFLWPKKPGVFVPYDAGPPRARNADEAKWNEERDRFVANVATKAPYFTSAQTEKMRRLTYNEFYSTYAGARKAKSETHSSGGPIYVGHVGIVEIDQGGVSWVIEALWGRGVIRHTYAEWVAERTGEVVWLGRLTELSAAQRARIPIEARKQIGKPYDFWNFDLNDESGFYCSKLAWMAAFRSLNLAVDGNRNPRRFFWFSPKQFLYVPRIARLIDPGPYATGRLGGPSGVG
jgi:cell wall-associated NlpC family hydrolase